MLEERAMSIVPCAAAPDKTIRANKPANAFWGATSCFPRVREFIRHVVLVSRTLPVVLVTTLSYLERLSANLPSRAYGNRETAYRVFVAAIIIASKYLNDCSLQNLTWSFYLAPWFSLAEINTMEQQFLRCINYELHIHPEQLCQILLANRAMCLLLFPPIIPRPFSTGEWMLSSLWNAASDELAYHESANLDGPKISASLKLNVDCGIHASEDASLPFKQHSFRPHSTFETLPTDPALILNNFNVATLLDEISLDFYHPNSTNVYAPALLTSF